MVELRANDFLIVVDVNIIKDLGDSRENITPDESRFEFVESSRELFEKMKSNIKICVDNKDKIINEYENSGGLKNPHVRAIFAQLVQDKILTLPINLTTPMKNALKIKGMKKTKDQTYIGVANSINNKRIIVTRDKHFYDPRNSSRIGISTTPMAIFLKRKFKIYPKTAKKASLDKLICKI